ncbi:four helix bundle protein [Parabacteroides sp. PF5-9]|uniref:four helix bundle protein n=1 Tax=Parabacteroides sp. PF5-9 TaxID=1742404 RepID=UPI0024746BA2|nr:four helix bundle protein [Parabacteroides sp. PF5-9]MDH6357642.1 four helix bundle protein [Parabacteroides sp. PF5-9]
MIDNKRNIVRTKSFDFALRIVKLYKYLCDEHKEFVLSKQILRSGTSIGAMQRESEHAESTPDFIHKLAVAQKECNETLYWLELLYKSEYIEDKAYESLYKDADELIRLLTSIIKTTKSNASNS